MQVIVGIDVSLDASSIYVIDEQGVIIKEGKIGQVSRPNWACRARELAVGPITRRPSGHGSRP